MKNIVLILSVATFIFMSCDKPRKRVEKEVTIQFNNGSGSFACGEYCGTTIDIVNGENNLKSKYELPDSITNKWEWWNREYIATIKFLNKNCVCKNGDAEPKPGKDFGKLELKMIEILKIREK